MDFFILNTQFGLEKAVIMRKKWKEKTCNTRSMYHITELKECVFSLSKQSQKSSSVLKDLDFLDFVFQGKAPIKL